MISGARTFRLLLASKQLVAAIAGRSARWLWRGCVAATSRGAASEPPRDLPVPWQGISWACAPDQLGAGGGVHDLVRDGEGITDGFVTGLWGL